MTPYERRVKREMENPVTEEQLLKAQAEIDKAKAAYVKNHSIHRSPARWDRAEAALEALFKRQALVPAPVLVPKGE